MNCSATLLQSIRPTVFPSSLCLLSDCLIMLFLIYIYIFISGPQPLCTYLDQGGNQVNRGRMRTVFTDSQTKQLDQLFEQTNYPGVEGRAELARNMGLTEESVRVREGYVCF